MQLYMGSIILSIFAISCKSSDSGGGQTSIDITTVDCASDELCAAEQQILKLLNEKEALRSKFLSH